MCGAACRPALCAVLQGTVRERSHSQNSMLDFCIHVTTANLQMPSICNPDVCIIDDVITAHMVTVLCAQLALQSRSNRLRRCLP